MQNTEALTRTEGHTAENAVKLIGEGFLPGASLLLDGNILAGGAHLILGSIARASLGPFWLAVVMANSYSQSTTGKNLIKQFKKDDAKPEGKAGHKSATS